MFLCSNLLFLNILILKKVNVVVNCVHKSNIFWNAGLTASSEFATLATPAFIVPVSSLAPPKTKSDVDEAASACKKGGCFATSLD